MVLPASDRISRVRPYSGSTQEGTKFRLQGCHLLWRAFPDRFVYPVPLSLPCEWSYNPKRQASWFGLFPFRSPLLRESNFSFSSSRYLDVSVPWVCLQDAMNSRQDTVPLRTVGFPIRKSPDQSLLTAPRSISVLVPSFIGS